MILNIIMLVAGFVLLVKGAGLLIDGAGSIAKRLGMSELVLGLTIVAFGTSAPEMLVSIIGGLNGNNAIVLGNVIGSNIFNTLMILGVCGIYATIKIKTTTVKNEVPLALLAGVLLLLLGNGFLATNFYGDGISRIDGIILLFFFVIFVLYTLSIAKKDAGEKDAAQAKAEKKVSTPPLSILKSIIYILLGLVGLYFGGKFVIDNAVEIATQLNMSEKIIAVTIVAMGTSLPEFVTAIISIRKGKSDLLVGNIIGSNIFNIFLVIGISAIINPIPYIAAFNIDMMFYIFGIIIFLVSMRIGQKYRFERWTAFIFLFMYLAYITMLFI